MSKLADVFVDVFAYINNLAKDISTTLTQGDSHQITVLVVFYLIVAISVLLLIRGFIKAIKLLFREIFPAKAKKKQAPVTAEPQVPAETHIVAEMSAEEKSFSLLKSFAGKGYSKIILDTFDNCNKIDHGVPDYECIKDTISPLSIIDDLDGVVPDKKALSGQVENLDLNELSVFLSLATKEKVKIDDKVIALKKLISEANSIRDKIAEKELAAINKYNSGVDGLVGAKVEFESRKANLSISYTELCSRINDIENRIIAFFNDLKALEAQVSIVPQDIESFYKQCDELATTLVAELQNKEKALASDKNDYLAAHKTRAQKDEEVAAKQKELEEALNSKINQDALLIIASERSKELIKADNERKAKEEAERKAQIEAERLAKEESERKAKEEAQRLAKEEEQRALKRLEEERLEQERRQKDILAQQKVSAADKQNATEAAMSVADSEINKVKSQLEEYSQNSYALNFEGVSPEMLEKMARAKQKRSMPGEEKASGDVSAVPNEPMASANNSNGNNDSEDTGSAEEPRDYLSELKQQWAAEKEHKKRWDAEKARRKEEEMRRKEELSKKLSENKFSDANE